MTEKIDSAHELLVAVHELLPNLVPDPDIDFGPAYGMTRTRLDELKEKLDRYMTKPEVKKLPPQQITRLHRLINELVHAECANEMRGAQDPDTQHEIKINLGIARRNMNAYLKEITE